ncbi:MAG: tetratricopeptide repeat protein [Deltaproteobacteria bacterium]|jgi:TolB-like protein/DNA-binding winged helix-turn-helix (wHTH) protein/Flp pilus assembly protein TadD|nr:tetratricopeptide repeat protein [Deltaproteobacteria bacterium]
MLTELQQGFRLGEFVIRPMQGTASGPGGVHHVPPRAMEVLLCLAKAPGKVVTRQALLSELWDDEHRSDVSLTRCVSELRHQFGDHRELPTYIQTLPKRGYRLVAKVSDLSEPNSSVNARDGPTFPAFGQQVISTSPGSLGEFIEDLKRRRVFRVALIYLICAWFVVQVAEATFPALLIPLWGQTLVVVLTIIGFPIAMILAWAFQITPDGIRTDVSLRSWASTFGKRKLDYAVIAALIAVIGFLGFLQFSAEEADQASASAQTQVSDASPVGGPDEAVDSIAVLPFVNMSGDSSYEYFSDGLSEEILNSLTRLKELKVAARTSSFYFKDKDVDIPTIAEHLGVRHVLEGSVRQQGRQIRVTAQLIRADTGFHVWSQNYDRELEGVLDIQSNIAHNVVKALKIVLSTESGAQLERQPTTSFEAYEFYLQARDYLRKAEDESALETAEALFEKAIAIDVAYAEAYAGLCDTYLLGYEWVDSTELFERAERACHRALTLDATAACVHTALGNLYRNSGQYQKAAQSFERAIALNASAVSAYDGLAETYAVQGLSSEAEQNYRRVIEIEPRFWRGYISMGNFLFSTGRPEEAIENYLRVTEMTPDNSTAFLDLGSAYYMVGEYEKAVAAWERSGELLPSKFVYGNIGTSHFFQGRFEEAIEMYQRAIDLSPDDYESWGLLGDACRFAEGHAEQAEQAYARAIELAQEALLVNPSDAKVTSQLAHFYANTDEPELARESIARALTLAPRDMYVFYDAAVTNVSLGEIEDALAAIEQAVELGYPVEMIYQDAGLEPLIDTERFATLVEKSEDEGRARQ